MRAFFYGTLMDAEVRACVLGRWRADQPKDRAVLRGYRRAALRGRSYPAIVPARRALTPGIVVAGLRWQQMERLRRFEGEEYRLARREVELMSGQRVAAWTFLASSRASPLPIDWDPDEWRRRHKAAFLRRLRADRVA